MIGRNVRRYQFNLLRAPGRRLGDMGNLKRFSVPFYFLIHEKATDAAAGQEAARQVN